jgi:hypothetical protein
MANSPKEVIKAPPMNYDALIELFQRCKTFRGKSFEEYLYRYISYTHNQLDRFTGTFTASLMAKTTSILRKRGLIESEKHQQSPAWGGLIKAIQNTNRKM